jgi:HAD superfamily hydrolase (TIGR01509 family)
MIPLPRALIFDVDGTLAETEEAHRQAFNDAFTEAGLDWRWDVERYGALLAVTGGKERIGRHLDDLGAPPDDPRRALIAGLHARKTELYVARVASGDVRLRPGVEALIARARRCGVALAMATTTTRANVDGLLKACLGPEALGWFDPIVCGDAVARKKPAPDVYLSALAALRVSPADALAIEDSGNGVRAARAAGLRVVVTPSLYGASDDVSEATLVVKDCHELARRLDWPMA